MSPRQLILILCLLFLLSSPLLAKEPEGDEVPVATAKQVSLEMKVFKRDFDTVDIDFKLDAVIRLSKCVHKDVTKKLLSILFRDKDPYIQAEAAKGLKYQVPFADMIGKKVSQFLEDDKADPKILTQLIRTMGQLKCKRSWEAIVDLIAHESDEVVVAAFNVLGDWKELRAWRVIQLFWDRYPEDGKWTTGSVTVDTGADTATEQRLAKAKWKAKFGGRANQRPRPDCVKALRAAVNLITGEDLKKPAEFRDWCRAHKQKIKAAERARD